MRQFPPDPPEPRPVKPECACRHKNTGLPPRLHPKECPLRSWWREDEIWQCRNVPPINGPMPGDPPAYFTVPEFDPPPQRPRAPLPSQPGLFWRLLKKITRR